MKLGKWNQREFLKAESYLNIDASYMLKKQD